jgi:hypothetical protein
MATGQVAIPAAFGDTSGGQSKREIDTTLPANQVSAAAIGNTMTSPDMETTYHVHPKQETSTTSGTAAPPGTTVFGGTTTTTTHQWNQGPSSKDLLLAAGRSTRLGYEMVVGARDKRVYFYNGKGTIGTMPLTTFVSAR